MRLHLLDLLVATLVLALAACTEVPTVPPDRVTAKIGAAGGSLSHPSGAALEIPAGALTEDVEISIQTHEDVSNEALGATRVGSVFELGPEGQTFTSPVTVTVPFDSTLIPAGRDATSLTVRIAPKATLVFEELTSTVDAAAGMIKATTTHFSVVTASSGSSGACVGADLVNTAPVTAAVREASASPYGAPAGGAIAYGTYYRASDITYTGPSGASGPIGVQRRHLLRLSDGGSGTYFVEEINEEIGSSTRKGSQRVTLSGSELNIQPLCPTAGPFAVGYSSFPASSSFVTYENASGGTKHLVFQLSTVYDGGTGGSDAGQTDAGQVDSGTPDAGPTLETLATTLTDSVSLTLGSTEAFVLGGGEVRKCALTGCGASPTLVTNVYASSIAISGTKLFAGTDFRKISSCDVSGTCTLTEFVDVGANTYPTQLATANGRIYWMSENGSGRRIQVCPEGGCSAGYPKFVYDGALMNGLALAGLAVNATDAYAILYQGGIYRFPLTDADTADAGASALLVGTDFGSNGLTLDGTTLRWANAADGKIWACELPACAPYLVKTGLSNPTTVRADGTHVFAVQRGQSNGSGGYVAGTATLVRYAK